MTDTATQGQTKKDIEHARRLRQLRSIVPCILLCIAVLIVGWMGWGNILNEARGAWFSKSGACVTALTIVISQRIQTLERMILPRSSFGSVEVSQLLPVWIPKLKMLQSINLLLGISSALIWGYGDTLFNAIWTWF